MRQFSVARRRYFALRLSYTRYIPGSYSCVFINVSMNFAGETHWGKKPNVFFQTIEVLNYSRFSNPASHSRPSSQSIKQFHRKIVNRAAHYLACEKEMKSKAENLHNFLSSFFA